VGVFFNINERNICFYEKGKSYYQIYNDKHGSSGNKLYFDVHGKRIYTSTIMGIYSEKTKIETYKCYFRVYRSDKTYFLFRYKISDYSKYIRDYSHIILARKDCDSDKFTKKYIKEIMAKARPNDIDDLNKVCMKYMSKYIEDNVKRMREYGYNIDKKLNWDN
jgi:hypothetical protein